MLKCNCSRSEYTQKLEYRKYRSEVQKVTSIQPLYLLEHFNKRGKSGKVGSYHLDHILSISYGFHNKISPDIIGNIRNLRMIPWRVNLEKGEFMEKESWEMFEYFVNEGTL